MTLVPNEMEQALNRQHDVYAAARDEYRKKIAEQAAEIEVLRAALERMLLEFDFMVESGVISDVRNDIIFVEARAALEEGRT